MNEVVVDEEKLAYGLKRGIGQSNTLFRSLEDKNKLRASPCGLVSSAIHQYLIHAGLPSRLLISTPKLACDPEMQHCFNVVGTSPDTELVVDASYSQFLGYVGLHYGYERITGYNHFPKEEIIDFRLSKSYLVAEWLTTVATKFQRKNVHPLNRWGLDAGGGPLEGASHAVIYDNFSQIWDRAKMAEWTPPEYVVNDGLELAKHIPAGSVIIV